MKNLNIISIIIAMAFVIVVFYFYDKCNTARSFEFWGQGGATNLPTIQAGLASIPFFLFFLIAHIYRIIKNKERFYKINWMIILLSVILFVWDMLMLNSPSHISFDEVGIAWMAYAFVLLFLEGYIFYRTYTSPDQEPNPEILDDMV